MNSFRSYFPDPNTSTSATPKVDLLEGLLKIYTEAQLWQFLRQSIAVAGCATGEQQIGDVTMRFKRGHLRWVIISMSEDADYDIPA